MISSVRVVVFSRQLFVFLARFAEDFYPPSLRVGSIVSLEPSRAPTVATTPLNTQLACDGTAYSASSSYDSCESVQDTTRFPFQWAAVIIYCATPRWQAHAHLPLTRSRINARRPMTMCPSAVTPEAGYD